METVSRFFRGSEQSFFLFGPRGTGKSTWLKSHYRNGGMSFWARGYFVSTVGTDEDVVRTYIRDQEKEDTRVEQLSLFK